MYWEQEQKHLTDWVQQQSHAAEVVKELAHRIAEESLPIWAWGDGQGGYVLRIVAEALMEHNIVDKVDLDILARDISPRNKALRLRYFVMERDEYRCRSCGDWHNLQIDHIYPSSRGGLTVPENLQVLCAACNSKKGSRIIEP
jgi:hypothetical protein